MVMQVAGVSEWLQAFNSLYAVGDLYGNVEYSKIHLLPLAFNSQDDLLVSYYDEFYEGLSMQARPPGLSHSSAMLSVFCLVCAALHLGELKDTRSRW
jgi:hypothetical protein